MLLCCCCRCFLVLLAVAEWDGGLVLVSHDFRLISQVANEIWEVRDGGVHIWRGGDIAAYKRHLRDNMEALQKRKDLA